MRPTDIIGGTFGRNASPSFKKRIRELIKWYGVQLDKLGVDIKLNTKVGLDDPCLVNADEILWQQDLFLLYRILKAKIIRK